MRMNLSSVSKCCVLFLFLAVAGCATGKPSASPDAESQTPTLSETSADAGAPALPGEKALSEDDAPPSLVPELADSRPTPLVSSETDEKGPAPDLTEKSDQELLDSALEFCQASYDFWDKGDLDNAVDALDQAYSLILKVNPQAEPEILQQRDDLRITISKRIVECYSSRFTVANGYHKAIPLTMNKHVERALNLLTGREKDFFLGAYRRSGRYRPAIVKALKEAGMPEELSWLPLIESGFKVRALSRARALGLWQFIASTGYKYGLKRDQWVDERMDPEKATEAAIAYLKELHQIFGDWTTVLAAYNCGEGNVLKYIRTQRINYLDNFWDLYEKLPRETAFYVPKFLAVLHIINKPEAYGITLPPVDEPLETEVVTVNKQVHLKTISDRLGLPFDLLEDLNPSLRRESTPDRPYAFNVPKGKGETLLAELEDMPLYRPPVPAYVVHRVQRGETLSVIARRYRSSVRAIMALNGLRSSHYLKVGWRLKVPTRRGLVYAAPDTVRRIASGQTVKYRVRRGDSLWEIARRHGTTVKAIQALNGLGGTYLRAGQVLTIRGGSSDVTKIKTEAYRVMKGDSPYLIAQKHQMDLSDFLTLNNLTPRSTIFPGQVLLVKAD